jgi:PAS domain S-box-containing protein
MNMDKKPDKEETTDEGVGQVFVQPIMGSKPAEAGQRLTVGGIGNSAVDLAALQGFFEALPTAVYTCEAPSGVITFYNKHAVRLWGRAPGRGETDEHFCGSLRLWRPDGTYLPHDQTPMAVALRDGHSFRNEEVIIERPDGTRINVLVNIDPIWDATGRVVGAINAFQDVTPLKQAEEVRARLAAIVETSDDAIVSKSPEGIIQSWNAGAERIFGYSAAEVVGQPINLIIPPELQDEERLILERLRQGERIEHFETVRISKEGGRIDISLTISPIRDATGRIVGASKVARDITKRKKAEEALQQLTETLEERVEARTQQVRQLASELVTAEQRVRRRIAHLLHDDLQQMLYAVEIQLAFLSDDLGKPDKFDEVVKNIRQALSLTRQLAVELSPPVLEGADLQETLTWLAQHMVDAYQLQVTVEASDTFPTANEEQRILLYHNIRELLFNVVKHAGVQTAQVRLQAEEDGFRVTVSDQGQGFDTADMIGRGSGYFGLRNVHERQQLFGGQAIVDSQPGAGTRVTLFLPYG